MKVFISCDIEGVSGVVSAQQHTSPEGKDYARARELMTMEANAAIAGAFKAGASCVVVNDSHGPMTNLLIEKLDPRASLITGAPKELSMMQGISEEYDAVMFIGYHSMRGTAGVLSHTISGRVVSNIWVNEVPVGETGINAGLAGHFGVPVVLVTGDNVVCQEAKALLPHVETAAVKEAVSAHAAKCLAPEVARALIEEKAVIALGNLGKAIPWKVTPPVTFKLELKDAGMAYNAARMPYTKVLNPTTVAFTADNYLTAFKGLRAMIALAV